MNRKKAMQWIYRFQQRVAITRSECNLVLGLVLLFGLGLTVRYVQREARPLSDAVYAEAAQAFEQAAATPMAEAQAMPAPAAQPTSKTPAKQAAYRSKPAPTAPIDLNTATASQLQRLPRIGPKLAERILAYRKAHGPFQRVKELLQVRGIGKKTLAGMEPFLFVQDAE